MMILTVLGYLILFLLAWAGLDILVFTMAYAWQGGKAQAERRITYPPDVGELKVSFCSVTLDTP